MFDYEKDRIVGKKETVANDAHHQVLDICMKSSSQMDHPGERACLLAGISLPPLAGISFIFGNHLDPVTQPDVDDVCFGACYVMASIEPHENGVIAGFSAMNVQKAMEMFKHLMGRDYPVNPMILKVLDQLSTNAKEQVPDRLKKFIKS